MRRSILIPLALLSAALLAAPAAGAGGPVAGTDAGATGVTAPGGGSRYVTMQAPGGTVVARVARDGGQLSGWRFLRRRVVVPAVAYDGSATGLSADGRTLVLAQPRIRYPRARSHFVVLDAARLRTRSTITLRGDFTLDAVSPDGDRLYLIQSLSRRDITRYAVRAYDVSAGRLLKRPIVDPAEADEPMQGSPLARAMSENGRWAYTLYDGNGEHPFIHALDTQAGTAKCVDLDQLSGTDDLFGMRLTVGPSGAILLSDSQSARTLLTVDPQTFAVREPAAVPARTPAPARPPQPSLGDDRGGVPWTPIVAGVLLLALIAAGVAAGRRGRGGPAERGLAT